MTKGACMQGQLLRAWEERSKKKKRNAVVVAHYRQCKADAVAMLLCNYCQKNMSNEKKEGRKGEGQVKICVELCRH